MGFIFWEGVKIQRRGKTMNFVIYVCQADLRPGKSSQIHCFSARLASQTVIQHPLHVTVDPRALYK